MLYGAFSSAWPGICFVFKSELEILCDIFKRFVEDISAYNVESDGEIIGYIVAYMIHDVPSGIDAQGSE